MNETIILLLISSGLSWGIIFYLLFRKNRSEKISSVSRLVLVETCAENTKEWTLLEKNGILIGREDSTSSAELQLREETNMEHIALKHAVLNYSNGIWYLEALQNDCATGLRKNGKNTVYRVRAYLPYPLEAGDMIYVAHYKLAVR